jgi:transketolase
VTYEEHLKQLIDEDDRIIVMTAENRAAIRNLPEQIGDKFIDTGITEMTLVGAAAGLALRGRIPVAHALATFLTMRAFEFIRTDVGIPNLPVKLIGAFPGFLSDGNGPTHQAIEDISIMRGIPNVNVWCPADEDELLSGLRHVIEHPQPFYVRYNNRKPVTVHSHNFEIGKSEMFSEGTDVTILTYGFCFSESFLTKNLLEEKGLSVGLINMRTLKPVDHEVILDVAKSSKSVVIIEDHFKKGGLYSIVAELLLDNRMTANVISISLEDKWFKPATLPDVLEYEGFTPDKLAEKILKEI